MMTDFSMDTAARIVTQSTTVELLDQSGFALPLETDFQYDARDPYAAVVTFNTERGHITWSFGRDLLIGGLHEPTGDGDVHVWPCLDSARRPVVMIELTSVDGCALVQAPIDDVRCFIDRSIALVAPGTESDHLDLDAEIAALLAV
jgi:Streptomyces sporulation and cell division protein, SsgA